MSSKNKNQSSAKSSTSPPKDRSFRKEPMKEPKKTLRSHYKNLKLPTDPLEKKIAKIPSRKLKKKGVIADSDESEIENIVQPENIKRRKIQK